MALIFNTRGVWSILAVQRKYIICCSSFISGAHHLLRPAAACILLFRNLQKKTFWYRLLLWRIIIITIICFMKPVEYSCVCGCFSPPRRFQHPVVSVQEEYGRQLTYDYLKDIPILGLTSRPTIPRICCIACIRPVSDIRHASTLSLTRLVVQLANTFVANSTWHVLARSIQTKMTTPNTNDDLMNTNNSPPHMRVLCNSDLFAPATGTSQNSPGGQADDDEPRVSEEVKTALCLHCWAMTQLLRVVASGISSSKNGQSVGDTTRVVYTTQKQNVDPKRAPDR